MVERTDPEAINVSWNALEIPKKYKRMDEKAKEEFLSAGVKTLAQNMEDLSLGLSGNVRLVDKLVTTPAHQKESIPVNEFNEAGVGFEYATDIFTWAYKMPAHVPIRANATKDVVTEADRTIVVNFLGKLNEYLSKKYNS